MSCNELDLTSATKYKLEICFNSHIETLQQSIMAASGDITFIRNLSNANLAPSPTSGTEKCLIGQVDLTGAALAEANYHLRRIQALTQEIARRASPTGGVASSSPSPPIRR